MNPIEARKTTRRATPTRGIAGMKLRIARKIYNRVGSADGSYSEAQIYTALRRVRRTRSAKEDEAFWASLMVTHRRMGNPREGVPDEQ